MMALSLTQPWAWLVVHGGKRVENRTWNTMLRGRFLIHASKGMTEDDYLNAFDLAWSIGGEGLADRIPGRKVIERGGIVGVAEITGVLQRTEAPTIPWHMPGQFGFLLTNVEPLPFKPCKGSLGFWNAGHIELPEQYQRA